MDDGTTQADGIDASAAQRALGELVPALHRLDDLVAAKLATPEGGRDNGDRQFSHTVRGLFLERADIEQIVAQEPLTPTTAVEQKFTAAQISELIHEDSPLLWLQNVFQLTPRELDIVLIALAPDLDLRYERVFAYLQDDVTKKRPTVGLALDLLGDSREVRVASRVYFASDAPLLKNKLIHLIADPHQACPPLLAHFIRPDEQIIRLLLRERRLDSRLEPFCKYLKPTYAEAYPPIATNLREGLRSLARNARESRHSLRIYLCGGPEIDKRPIAEAMAADLGVPLLVVDLERAIGSQQHGFDWITYLFREAWFDDAILFMDGIDEVFQEEHRRSPLCAELLDALENDGGITLMAGEEPWRPPGHRALKVLSVDLPAPDVFGRRACWASSLSWQGVPITDRELDALAGRFRLSPLQIREATADACQRAQMLGNGAGREVRAAEDRFLPGIDELFDSARRQSRRGLAAFARKIEPKATWDDIVLPADSALQLRELCERVKHHDRVLSNWGFERKLSRGMGTTALFAGPSGTGKTMACEVIAHELGLDLYRIDLAGVVSKYIGETEKNLDRVFAAAEGANAVLLFDEADALFGKRSEVRDSHDRYANVEISYLLQKLEEFDGVGVMATNMRQNLDPAFQRRLSFTISFPSPDATSRAKIWESVWPPEAPLSDKIDFDALAAEFNLSGGNIRNAALAAAFLAAEEESRITEEHILRAVRREYQKLGKNLSSGNLAKRMSGSAD